MIRTKIFLRLLLATGCLSGCLPPQPSAPSLRSALLDSLDTHATFEPYLKNNGHDEVVLYGTTLNKTRIGIMAFADSLLLLFQSNGQQLILTDSIAFDNYATSFELTDLNGDGKRDLMVHSVPDMHGQNTPYVFLTQIDGKLHYRPDLQLPNIRFNKETHLVESYYESCASCLHSKQLLRWQADSLHLITRAELDLTAPAQITTRVFQILHGVEQPIINVTGANGIYDTVLFNIHPRH